MTVYELISQFDIDRPNSVTQETKIRWLKDVEMTVMQDVILKHHPLPKKLIDFAIKKEQEEEKEEGVVHIGKRRPHFEFMRWFDDWDENKELLIDSPYTNVYMDYLDMKTAWSNNEAQRYNAASQMYNASSIGYQQYYNRTYTPNRTKPHYLDHTRL